MNQIVLLNLITKEQIIYTCKISPINQIVLFSDTICLLGNCKKKIEILNYEGKFIDIKEISVRGIFNFKDQLFLYDNSQFFTLDGKIKIDIPFRSIPKIQFMDRIAFCNKENIHILDMKTKNVENKIPVSYQIDFLLNGDLLMNRECLQVWSKNLIQKIHIQDMLIERVISIDKGFVITDLKNIIFYK